jgi:hypothetical protein
MPSRGTQLWCKYVCLDSNSKPLAGDLANHSIFWTADNTRAQATNNHGGAGKHVELGNGLYNILITAAEATCDCGGIDGTSSTSNAVIVPVAYSFDLGGAIKVKTDLYPYTLYPLASTVSAGEVTDHQLVAYQGSRVGPYAFTIEDGDGNPVNLSGKAVKFVLLPFGSTSPTHTASSTSTGGEVSVGSTDHNVVTVTLGSTLAGSVGNFEYELKNTTDKAMLDRGSLRIRRASKV